MIERKVFSFELTAVDPEGRTFEGYAAAFGNIDQTDDILHPGAFKKTLTERGPKIKLLWQHSTDEPIGRPLELREDQRGLFIRALVSDTRRGRDALALLKDQAIFEMSIGYEVPKGGSDYTKDTGGKLIRNLREVKLWEVSLVTFPANEEAVVTAVKEAAHTKEMGPDGRPIKRFGDMLQGTIHSVFTQMADRYYVAGYLSRDERIQLSGLIGNALDVLTAGMPETVAMLECARDEYYLYALPVDFDTKDMKAGRVLSATNASKVQAALDALAEVLKAAGLTPDGNDEDENDGKPSKGTHPLGHPSGEAGPGDGPPTPAPGAGPDGAPPTFKDADVAALERASLELDELALTLLEVD